MTEEELGEIGLPPPFWAFAWAGGQALARYLLDHPDEVAGKRVLDFATGSGLVAIAAMKAGAAEALAADIDRSAQAAMALNAEVNAVEVASPAPNCWTAASTGRRRDPRRRHLLRAAAGRAGDGLARRGAGRAPGC